MTVKHGTLDQMKDAMNVWIESISRSQFEVCLRESRTFGGAHNGLVVVHVTLILNDFNLFFKMIEIPVYSPRLFSEQISRFDCNQHMLKGNA